MIKRDSGRGWGSDTDTVESPVSRGQIGPTALFELFGDTPGRVIEVNRDRTFVGRDGASFSGTTIQIPHSSVSRQHAVLILDGEGLSIRDLGSTNGTYVNGHKITAQSLFHGDLVKLGRAVFKVLVDPDLPAAVAAERLRLLRVDPLTQLLNRATFLEELRFRLQSGQGVCVLVGVVDDFVTLRKQHRAVAVEHLLSGLAQVLTRRGTDQQQLGRIGPATFAVLVPGADAASGRRLAQGLARHVAATAFSLDGEAIPLSMTFGVADHEAGAGPEDLLAAAVELLPRHLVALD